jgi:isoleucyl-tRNA synthetase
VDGSGQDEQIGRQRGRPGRYHQEFGAEVLRLWVAAQDYRDDIRISQEILNRLSSHIAASATLVATSLETWQVSDPATDSVPVRKMPEIDRWALHQLELLKEKVLQGYESCEFHVLYHAVNSFCTMEMSAFYLYPQGSLTPARLIRCRGEAPRQPCISFWTCLVKLLLRSCPLPPTKCGDYMPKQEESVHLAQFPPCSRKTRMTNWSDDGTLS